VPEINWNLKADYLLQTRGLWHVWKMTRPLDLVDFGCGFGYMGQKLLPLLPEGSSYTGLDLADALLAKARDLFAETPYRTRFVMADATSAELEPGHYDVAMCHALLLHTTDPVRVLQQMRRAVKPGGLVVCIEPHWIGGLANTHYHGDPQSTYVKLGILQHLFEMDTERTGKDGNVGIKVPVYMDAVGLTDIECRLSDKVNLLLPHQEGDRKDRLLAALRADGHGSPPQDQDRFRQRLGSRGLSGEFVDQPNLRIILRATPGAIRDSQ